MLAAMFITIAPIAGWSAGHVGEKETQHGAQRPGKHPDQPGAFRQPHDAQEDRPGAHQRQSDVHHRRPCAVERPLAVTVIQMPGGPADHDRQKHERQPDVVEHRKKAGETSATRHTHRDRLAKEMWPGAQHVEVEARPHVGQILPSAGFHRGAQGHFPAGKSHCVDALVPGEEQGAVGVETVRDDRQSPLAENLPGRARWSRACETRRRPASSHRSARQAPAAPCLHVRRFVVAAGAVVAAEEEMLDPAPRGKGRRQRPCGRRSAGSGRGAGR